MHTPVYSLCPSASVGMVTSLSVSCNAASSALPGAKMPSEEDTLGAMRVAVVVEAACSAGVAGLLFLDALHAPIVKATAATKEMVRNFIVFVFFRLHTILIVVKCTIRIVIRKKHFTL